MALIAYNNHDLLLTYSTNVHPGETLDDLDRVIRNDVAAVKARAFPRTRLGLNLRLGLRQIEQLQDPAARERLGRALDETDTFLFTINGFPLRDFHAERVKQDVYRPSWQEAERADATIQLAHLLAEFLPDAERVGSISSLSGCYRPLADDDQTHREMARQVARVVVELVRLEMDSGKEIVLGLEPEPFTTAETVPAFIGYYENHLLPQALEALEIVGLSTGEAEDAVRRHLGVQLDLCHQSVQFEDVTESIRRLEASDIRLAAIHVSSALRLDQPHDNPEGLAHLRRFAEPKYLHQTFGADAADRVVLRLPDLSELGEVPAEVATIKTHFHMPLFQEPQGALRTTADEIPPALHYALQRQLTRHIVVETYTWNVLLSGKTPEAEGVESVHDGIAREMRWCLDVIDRMAE